MTSQIKTGFRTTGMGAAMIVGITLGVLVLAAAMTSMVVLLRRRANVVDPRGT